jgi:hypothetical protein
LVEPEHRTAFINSPSFLLSVYKKRYRFGVSSIFVADEDFSPPLCYGIASNIALKEIVHLKASQINEAGIIRFLIKDFTQEISKMKPKDIGPQVLTLNHLEASFVIICVLLILSVFAFVVECRQIVINELKLNVELGLMCYIVVKFVKMKKLL